MLEKEASKKKRNKVRSRIFTAIVALLIMLPTSTVFSETSIEPLNKEELIIHITNTHQIDHLINMDIDVLEDYDCFVLAEATNEQRILLRNIGFEVENANNMKTISIAGYTFDPKERKPSFPINLKIDSYPIDSEGYHLVQFFGPVKEEWKVQIENLGASLECYLPYNTFIVKMNSSLKERVERLRFVRWVGLYQPAYKISQDLLGLKGQLVLNILTFKGEKNSVVQAIQELGGNILRSKETTQNGLIRVTIDSSMISKIANVIGVRWIEQYRNIHLMNDNAQWVLQSNVFDNRPIWDHGLHGEGQIIGNADTGIDVAHWAFNDTEHNVQYSDPPGSLPPDPNHRKIVNYHVFKEDNIDLGGHGTHTACTNAGDDKPNGGNGVYNGMADNAKISFQDLEDSTGFGGPDVDEILLVAYNDGAIIHSDSWGVSVYGEYAIQSMQADEFMWDHKDFLAVFATGNNYRIIPSTAAPATAKNVVSVGACDNGASAENMRDYSSGGPTKDGRLKPTLVAPGEITSATAGTQDDYHLGSGTSCACPVAAGGIVLIRQYFTEGWYPSGDKKSGDGFSPSAALMKAMAINGAVEISGIGAYDHPYDGMSYPSNDQGWGRIHLENCMYFVGDKRKLQVRDNTTGLSTGKYWEYSFRIVDTTEPLEVTLVWTDYPGDSSSSQSSPKIVNDLDLTVIAPNGDIYKGNVFTSKNPGYSDPNTGSWDRLNVEENVLILSSNVQEGVYKVNISAFNVPNGEIGSGNQPFALVVTGGLDVDVKPPTKLLAELSGSNLENITLTWTLSNDDGIDVENYAIYRNSTYDCNGTGYKFLAEIPAGTSYYIDNGSGDGDPNNYFYYVQANDTSGNTNWTGQAGKFVRELPSGRRLVSIPLMQSDTSLTTVLQTIEGNYNYVQWYNATDTTDHWKTYSTDKPSGFNDLLNADHKIALWITMTAYDNLTVAGRVPKNTIIQLYTGWNLVSYASFINRTVENALSDIWSNVEKVEGFDESASPYYLRTLAATDWMEAGNGYWIYAKENCTWTIEN